MISDDVITQLANQLGIAATEIFGIYAAGIAGTAMNNLVGMVVICMLVCIIAVVTYVASRKADATLFVSICATIVLWLIGLVVLDSVNRMMYPEYHALREIIRFM